MSKFDFKTKNSVMVTNLNKTIAKEKLRTYGAWAAVVGLALIAVSERIDSTDTLFVSETDEGIECCEQLFNGLMKNRTGKTV